MNAVRLASVAALPSGALDQCAVHSQNMQPLGEPLQRDGEFWLPENPDRSCLGQASFDPDTGIELKLFGSLRQMPDSFNNADIPNGLLHGRLENGAPISLFGSFRKSHQMSFGPGFPRETYRVNIAAIGVHVGSLKDKRFDSASFSVSGLEGWLERDWYPRTNYAQDMVFSVQTQAPRTDTIFKSRGYSLLVNRFSTIDQERRERLSIGAKADLKIESSSLRSIDWYLKQSTAVTSFLSFCLAQQAEIQSISVGYHEQDSDRRFRQVEIVYARIDHGKVDPDKPPLAPFSTLQDIRRSLREWMALYSASKSAIRLVHEVQSNQMKYVNLRFLLAAQSAEVFHREAFDPRRKTLRFRIDSLVGELTDVLGYAPKGLNEKFREKTVRTRNYYTHFSENADGKIFTSTEMYWASQRLATMIIILALHKIGVEADSIRNCLSNRDDLARILGTTGVPY